MRVILEIIDGPEVGRSIQLDDDQVLQVGRTDWADIALVADDRLADVHFRLESDGRFCRIRDLETPGGTKVNGRPIVEHFLSDGDRISAGASLFLVRIHGGADSKEVAAARSALPPTAAPPPRPRRTVRYTKETCTTGLLLYRGSIEDIPPAQLAGLLARELPLYLLIDFKKLGQVVPEELGAPQYLFDWLPIETARAVSPVVVPHTAWPGWVTVLEQGWGEDAAVCLFSREDADALRIHLRGEARAGSDSVVGYCWPCVLGPMLSYYRPESIRQFMQGIDAILVEFADLPETWQVFSERDLDATFQKLGFVPEVSQPVAASHENS